jgi:hypothetical protein
LCPAGPTPTASAAVFNEVIGGFPFCGAARICLPSLTTKTNVEQFLYNHKW